LSFQVLHSNHQPLFFGDISTLLLRTTKIALFISIGVLPWPIYYLIVFYREQNGNLNGGDVVNDRSIAVFCELGLIAFHFLLCCKIFCALHAAYAETVLISKFLYQF
jgi:hypothetical protein